MELLNALTVDVEDYFHVTAFEKHIDRDDWHSHGDRIVASTRRILRLFDDHNVKGTFFVLGWVAERFADLVREIHAAGHEIGSHSYWHRLIYDQTPEQFREDLCRSRDVLQDTIQTPVTAHRAPSFSITGRSLWALDILAEEGFRVDSSIFPTRHDRYGIPDAPTQIHQIETGSGPLWEFPPSVLKIGRSNVPVGGGGYFRLYPLSWTIRALARINRTTSQPFMFYMHPWEIDPEQPRVPVSSRLSRFRHYVNLAKTEQKLNALLARFRFGRLCDVIEQGAASEKQPTSVSRG